MVTTRSKSAHTQTHIPDFSQKETIKPNPKPRNGPKKSQPQLSSTGSPSKKRKDSLDPLGGKHEQKRAKTSQSTSKKAASTSSAEGGDRTIVINRAPVLQLWSACVAHTIYPSLSWSTCISVGGAISTICAVAKGRSIGTLAEKDTSEEAERKRRLAKRSQKDLAEVEVMHFRLKLKDGRALVGSERKGKSGDEDALRRKFGEGEYDEVKGAMEECLQGWQGEEEALNGKAFSFYEEFRPDVSKGQKGWGRKGELSLQKMEGIIRR